MRVADPQIVKVELESWAVALKAYDTKDFDKSIEVFEKFSDSAKILTNIGLIYATIGKHETAVKRFNAATCIDQYLAIAHFQCGVSNFLLERYEVAYEDFEETLIYLGGTFGINYADLGMKFVLYSAEVLFNQGLCQIYIGNLEKGLSIMREATAEQAILDHAVIDDAIRDQGEAYTSVGILFRRPPIMIRVKLHYADDVRGMAITTDTSFEQFRDSISNKFGLPHESPSLTFKALLTFFRSLDAKGQQRALEDKADFKLAIDTAQHCKNSSSERKLEVWCTRESANTLELLD